MLPASVRDLSFYLRRVFPLQVNIQSSQLQQNVEGTLVNVNAGNEGVVIVNTNDPDTGLVSKSTAGSAQFGTAASKSTAGQT